ncbi:unnamed protein product [Agarophyton chilense]
MAVVLVYDRIRGVESVFLSTVIIGKCGKMLPVLLILKLWPGRQCTYEEVVAVFGVFLDEYATRIKSGNACAKHLSSADTDIPFGIILMLFNWTYDTVASKHH